MSCGCRCWWRGERGDWESNFEGDRREGDSELVCTPLSFLASSPVLISSLKASASSSPPCSSRSSSSSSSSSEPEPVPEFELRVPPGGLWVSVVPWVFLFFGGASCCGGDLLFPDLFWGESSVSWSWLLPYRGSTPAFFCASWMTSIQGERRELAVTRSLAEGELCGTKK